MHTNDAVEALQTVRLVVPIAQLARNEDKRFQLFEGDPVVETVGKYILDIGVHSRDTSPGQASAPPSEMGA